MKVSPCGQTGFTDLSRLMLSSIQWETDLTHQAADKELHRVITTKLFTTSIFDSSACGC